MRCPQWHCSGGGDTRPRFGCRETPAAPTGTETSLFATSCRVGCRQRRAVQGLRRSRPPCWKRRIRWPPIFPRQQLTGDALSHALHLHVQSENTSLSCRRPHESLSVTCGPILGRLVTSVTSSGCDCSFCSDKITTKTSRSPANGSATGQG